MLLAMLRALVTAAALALASAACGDPRLAELRSISDEVCACKTAACGEAAMKRVPPPEGRGRPDHREQKIARVMMDCLAKLYRGERPSTDPDAEAPAPGAEAPAPGAAAPAPGAAAPP